MPNSKFNAPSFMCLVFGTGHLFGQAEGSLLEGVWLREDKQNYQMRIAAENGIYNGKIVWIKFTLTFLVPFLVATYASAVTKFQFRVGALAFVATELACTNCKKTLTLVYKNELIPPCPNCQDKTKWKHKTINP